MNKSEADVQENESNSIRSSVDIKQFPSKNPNFNKLEPKTDLKLAPSNWLRKTSGLRPEILIAGGHYGSKQNESNIPSSFVMANQHLSLIGNIDVVSDAEIIKKLLKMGIQYNKSQVSVVIHKIGRTLLFENFDLQKHIAQESEWKWFRDFYTNLGKHGSSKLLKKKRPSSQYERLMLSKFLYYSINMQEEPATKTTSKTTNAEDCTAVRREEGYASDIDKQRKSPRDRPVKQQSGDAVPYSIALPYIKKEKDTSSSVCQSERRWKHYFPSDPKQPEFNFTQKNDFERNILWTFEDLQMLLGTNMPIFGGGQYPAVSLVLQDSSKPINILTGIDYWLDNLICNVPELVMCFHVNGIVQNYEVIKTEDIPKLSNSVFKPQVVKDIAQNVLSFLKSNCTKEGHTYWLFKGGDDDVVKLYDLTTLMNAEDKETVKQHQNKNPYTTAVAMLLYRTSINLLESKDECQHKLTVKKLLCQCVDLLEGSENYEVIFSCLCILSTLCLPDMDKEIDQTHEDDIFTFAESTLVDCETCQAYSEPKSRVSQRGNTKSSKTNATELAMITSVKDLSIPQKFEENSTYEMESLSPKENRPQGVFDKTKFEDYKQALEFVKKGCSILKCQNTDEGAKFHYDKWRVLYRNCALVYYCMVKQSHARLEYGHALRYVHLALLSYDCLLRHEQNSSVALTTDKPGPEHVKMPRYFDFLKRKLLVQCGDLQLTMATTGLVDKSSQIADYHSYSDNDQFLEETFGSPEGFKYEHLTKIVGEIDRTLENCIACYKMSLEDFPTRINLSGSYTNKDSKRKSKKNEKKSSSNKSFEAHRNQPKTDEDKNLLSFYTAVSRKQGHVENELGSVYLNHAVNLLQSKDEGEGVTKDDERIWHLSYTHFETAIEAFSSVRDTVNQSLVLSNIGRLMRVCAQVYANDSDDILSKQERHFYSKAVDSYRQALKLLENLVSRKIPINASQNNDRKVTDTAAEMAYDNVSWELSSTYFNMGKLLQDNPPNNPKERRVAEREVTDFMNKSIRYCQGVWQNSAKLSSVQYRLATIHYRIASLNYNAYRLEREKNKKVLAEVHYDKSIKLYQSIDYPRDLLRVCLERITLRELIISEMTNNHKICQATMESLKLITECVQPLTSILNSIMQELPSPTSSSVDVPNTGDSSNNEELLSLLNILAKILLSHQHTLIKISSNHNQQLSTASSRSRVKQSATTDNFRSRLNGYKSLYSSTLRGLHNLQTRPIDGEKTEPQVGDKGPQQYLKLKSNLESLIHAIIETKTTLIHDQS